ncbi:hydrolase [Halalkalibacillus sediminis]|uniref:Hydrolase n=1 Tax=Halalkalibacillus sediminis TaxID=2018042 RepID=A0A2I0QUZ2_9BACI|nr:hydrolase [Halalkalibacillus sediminis]PKR78138.1 hydrolase [Halalkalibacillus sediminis]
MDERKFYVNIEAGEISELKAGNNDTFVIYGEPNDIIALRECLDEMKHAEFGTFLRSHVPFKEYHHDEDNDAVDDCMIRAYRLIYELGVPETKKHIESFSFFDTLIKDEEY